ncbi:hypothetical protein [Actinoplanes sp. NPDC020271]|uniref:hypothetical protein n=1 Tax=Actinoplanes sp. NPDC020271 TaxID=3363896 RepID=UPI0037A14DDF
MTERHQQWRADQASRIISEYHSAGSWFDGLYQNLLPHLREHRESDPRPDDIGSLAETVHRIIGATFAFSPVPWPYLVVDAGVLLSYARLDSETVGAALIDAVTDPSCRIITSPLSYLNAAARAWGTVGAERLRRLVTLQTDPAVEPVLTIPALDLDDVTVLAGISSTEPADVTHTALLALPYRCVIATLDPGAYHRIGYLRTLNLA